MDHYRLNRFSSTLKKNMADIFMLEINNPKLKKTHIIDVQVSADLKNAQIILSNIKLLSEKEMLEELDKSKGFIRKMLSRRMYLKQVPDLKFFIGSE